MIRVLALVLLLVLAFTTLAHATSWGVIMIMFTGDQDSGGGDPLPPPQNPPPGDLTGHGELSIGEFFYRPPHGHSRHPLRTAVEGKERHRP